MRSVPFMEWVILRDGRTLRSSAQKGLIIRPDALAGASGLGCCLESPIYGGLKFETARSVKVRNKRRLFKLKRFPEYPSTYVVELVNK